MKKEIVLALSFILLSGSVTPFFIPQINAQNTLTCPDSFETLEIWYQLKSGKPTVTDPDNNIVICLYESEDAVDYDLPKNPYFTVGWSSIDSQNADNYCHQFQKIYKKSGELQTIYSNEKIAKVSIAKTNGIPSENVEPFATKLLKEAESLAAECPYGLSKSSLQSEVLIKCPETFSTKGLVYTLDSAFQTIDDPQLMKWGCDYRTHYNDAEAKGFPDRLVFNLSWVEELGPYKYDTGCKSGKEFTFNAGPQVWSLENHVFAAGPARSESIPTEDVNKILLNMVGQAEPRAFPCDPEMWDKIEKEIDEAFDEKEYRCPTLGLTLEEWRKKLDDLKLAIDPKLDIIDPSINLELVREHDKLEDGACGEYFSTLYAYCYPDGLTEFGNYCDPGFVIDTHCKDSSGEMCENIQCDLKHAKSAKTKINEDLEEEIPLEDRTIAGDRYLDRLRDDLIKVQDCIDELENKSTENPFEKGVDQATEIGQDTVEKASEVGQIVAEKGTEAAQEIGEVGGCLIATATYGSELSPQVQQLREVRDNRLLQTESGSAFMQGFNDFYYSFSPGIADYERENPVFKETVKLAITPMISSLSILNHVDMDSDQEVLGYGISLILLNVGMYVGVPIAIIFGIRKHF